jgi:hypothetical protein
MGFEGAADSQNRSADIEGRFQIGLAARQLEALLSGLVDQSLLAPRDVFEAVGNGLTFQAVAIFAELLQCRGKQCGASEKNIAQLERGNGCDAEVNK